MPDFNDNIHFQLPGLGSAEKDTPGSFREGTPFNKVGGPDRPTYLELEQLERDQTLAGPVESSNQPYNSVTEISRELVDLKDQQKAVQHAGVKADMMKALSNHAKMEKEGATQQFIDQMNQAVDNTTSEEDKQQQFIDGLSGDKTGSANTRLGKDYARIDGESFGAGNVPDNLPNPGFLSSNNSAPPLSSSKEQALDWGHKETTEATPHPGIPKPQEEESLIDNLISGAKKYGPTIVDYISGGGALRLGKKISDRFKGE